MPEQKNPHQGPIRLAIVGGGPQSFIGPIHQSAAVLDRKFQIVAGAVSSDPIKAKAQGVAIGLSNDRAYASVAEMINGEFQRSEADRIEAVAVMSPNDRHFPDCCLALQAGLHVICDKPLTHSVTHAQTLLKLVDDSNLVFGVTYNYSGYPMVRQARAMVKSGAIGAVRMLHVEYFQGGMATRIEDTELTPKLQWKLNPERSGPSLVLGDIGTHAHHLASFVGSSPVTQVSADVGTVVPGRTFDDYAAIQWRFANGARGMCCVTQAAAGAENNISFRIYGETGMIEWQHTQANYLRHAPLNEPLRVLGRGDPYLLPPAVRATRIARGHPEGFRESFANLYSDFAALITEKQNVKAPDRLAHDLPNIRDGVNGLLFIEAVLKSSHSDGSWVKYQSV